uniref:Phosphofurin acidic cluster sorting protein 2 n=3 Tax=Cacopsylla melanoneura TaxID=428564 RepID=A0A8D8Y9G8_9HEMI
MSEKTSSKVMSSSSGGNGPVPMKLFATWEIDRTPTNCSPRLCSLTVSRLLVLKSLGSDLNSIVIAVKMEGSKRTLRSSEMILPSSGLLDTKTELNFSLQYPHFLKRDGNKLHVMLQRRKRYKNRTILGYKTLAQGIVNMSQVLQHQMDLELDLLCESKELKAHGSSVAAKVLIQSLVSQPIDQDLSFCKQNGFSDDDEEFSTGDENENEGSDSDPAATLGNLDTRGSARKSGKLPGGNNARQRNLKQKFIALLKRFRVNEELTSLTDTDQDNMGHKLSGGDMDPADIADLLDDLDEEMSDSGPEDNDTMSITSTPKPSLRPFFSSSKSLLNQDNLHVPEKPTERLSDESSKKADSDSHPDSDPPPPTLNSPPFKSQPAESTESAKKESTERDKKSRLFARDRNQSTGKSKKQSSQDLMSASGGVTGSNMPRQQSAALLLSPGQFQDSGVTTEPRKLVLDQLARLLPATSDDWIPDQLSLVQVSEPLGNLLASRLTEQQEKVISVAINADVRTCITCLVNKIHKFCNTNPKPPSQIKLILIGTDSFYNSVLRHYVDQLSYKPPDWQTYIVFYLVPIFTSSSLCRYLGSLDAAYNSMFLSDSWKESLDRACLDGSEAVTRILHYASTAGTCVQLPVAEAMLTYKEKSSDDESSQIFIPFINEVRLGNPLLHEVTGPPDPNSLDTGGSVNKENLELLPASPTSINNNSNSNRSTSNTVSNSNRSTSNTVSNSNRIDSGPASLTLSLAGEKISPPSSPNMNVTGAAQPTKDRLDQQLLCTEYLDLQLDYWLVVSKGSEMSSKSDLLASSSSNKKAENSSGKLSMKGNFKSLQIMRLSSLGEQPNTCSFNIGFSTKEKKQKIMRLGKKKEKEKDSDTKCQFVDGVSRLICSPKTHNVPLRVAIDGTEWTGVKFFQLSAQWQTHIRHFPVCLYNTVPEP